MNVDYINTLFTNEFGPTFLVFVNLLVVLLVVVARFLVCRVLGDGWHIRYVVLDQGRICVLVLLAFFFFTFILLLLDRLAPWLAYAS